MRNRKAREDFTPHAPAHMRATCIKERAERPSVLLSLAQRLLSSGALVALWHPMQLSGSGLSVRTNQVTLGILNSIALTAPLLVWH